jgi:quinol monooxygenase YgiN
MSFVLVVRIKAKPGSEERAAELLAELTTETRREPGCELYIPCRDPEDSGSFCLYEQYRDRAAFEEHGASEHFQRLAIGELFELVDREREFYETL